MPMTLFIRLLQHDDKAAALADAVDARRALIPLTNKRAFLEVSADILEHVDPIFYGDPKTAVFKALGFTSEELYGC